jgi:hypothetical protein
MHKDGWAASFFEPADGKKKKLSSVIHKHSYDNLKIVLKVGGALTTQS